MKADAVAVERTRRLSSFATLDDYLAFLEKGAAIDKAWYRKIGPDLYRLKTGNYRGAPIEKRIFTRAELAQRFGFAE